MDNVNERAALEIPPEPQRRIPIDPDGQEPVDHHPHIMEPASQASVLSPDATRMTLSDTERQWAMAIKEAVLQDLELDPLSDFDIVQVALLDRDNIEGAMERICKLQAFQQEYRVTDTVEQGQITTQRCLDLFPGLMLHISYQPSLGCHVHAGDVTKLYKSVVESQKDTSAAILVPLYYLFHATNPDFESMRQGLVILCECGGFSWTDNFKLEYFQKFWLELGGVYPIKLKKMMHYHTSLFFNLLHSMGRPFLPNDVKEVFEIGLFSALGRLDIVYLSPSVQTANARFKTRIVESLQTRHHNASNFRL
ncbi:expressed unknown protein [Seminavis robusta]|uniref:Uncharacterized protein n=1 Tax=Seminavis robusta TaxID=568900 RepID=A0A9N8DD05_9STRA|nr:expressed unknown protein [Seminavis robusta]|eukprot:Sro39_g024380.1 n/a (308) ;mRNA; f:150215-151138